MTSSLIEVALEPIAADDAETLKAVLDDLKAADPSVTVRCDHESGQTLLGGADELQLDGAVRRLIERVAINIGAPQVCYLETITRTVEVDETYTRALGSKGDFARVSLIFSPAAPGAGFSFENTANPNAVAAEYVDAVRKGIEAVKDQGLLAGFPITDFTATLADGAQHDVDSSVRAFEIAARRAFARLRTLGEPILLEPVMRVEASFPSGVLAEIRRDAVSRRGKIVESDETAIVAFIPMANMFGYLGALRHLTAGEGRYSMTFDHYQLVPRDDPDPTFTPAIGMQA